MNAILAADNAGAGASLPALAKINPEEQEQKTKSSAEASVAHQTAQSQRPPNLVLIFALRHVVKPLHEVSLHHCQTCFTLLCKRDEIL